MHDDDLELLYHSAVTEAFRAEIQPGQRSLLESPENFWVSRIVYGCPYWTKKK